MTVGPLRTPPPVDLALNDNGAGKDVESYSALDQLGRSSDRGVAVGFLGKLSGADKMTEICNQKLAQIESQFAAGRSEAAVLLTQEEIGTRFRMDNFSSFLCREFEKAGYQVIGATDPGWSYKMTITVIR